MHGILMRSRANIIENEEKSLQFSCSLESNHYSIKVINILKHENGEMIAKQKYI